MQRRQAIRAVWLFAVLLFAAGCGSDHGSDSLFGPRPDAASAGCIACHNASSTIAPDHLATNGSGTAGKHLRHVQFGGIPCARCHNNYGQAATHMNTTIDTGNAAVLLVLFDTSNPTGTWQNDTGPGTGTCSAVDCHGGYPLDWYGTGLPPCAACHFTFMGARRPVVGASGDFASNPSVSSHHVSGAGDPTPDQCRICHDMSLHMAGTVRLKEADTGAAVVFSAMSPSTAEPFCLSCHDADGAVAAFISGGTPSSPFNDGSNMGIAPNRASAEIKEAWNKTFGHRQQGLTCLGNGNPGTGCHGNGHGTAYVGLLARNLTLPSTTSSWYSPVNEPDYDLCFTCHASYPRVAKEAVLGMSPTGNYALDLPTGVLPAYAIGGIQTLFRDVNLGSTGKVYDDWPFFSAAHENLHMYHVQIGLNAWDYRDSIPSSVVCVSCHSVHGSNTQWGWVYDSIQFSHVTGTAGDQYGKIGAALNLLGNYPTSCAFNCHGILGPTSSWFEPSDE